MRRIVFVAAAASVLAGCQTTEPRLCDIRKPGDLRLYQGNCCDVSTPGAPCLSDNEPNEPNEPDEPNERPDPRPQ